MQLNHNLKHARSQNLKQMQKMESKVKRYNISHYHNIYRDEKYLKKE